MEQDKDTAERIPIYVTQDEAFDLLSAVSHYRQYTDSVLVLAKSFGDGPSSETLAKIARSMDAVAAQLIEARS